MSNVLEQSILEFFSDESNFKSLRALLSNKRIQPRLIDYYVTQFCKNTPEFFIREDGLNDVYNSYKLQLKGYHKKQFNLFEKRNIITLKCNGAMICLPLAKVNVYRWLITHGVSELLDDKHSVVQKKYYDFRKIHIDKTQKRGKMTSFLKTPYLIKGVSIAKKKIYNDINGK